MIEPLLETGVLVMLPELTRFVYACINTSECCDGFTIGKAGNNIMSVISS